MDPMSDAEMIVGMQMTLSASNWYDTYFLFKSYKLTEGYQIFFALLFVAAVSFMTELFVFL